MTNRTKYWLNEAGGALVMVISLALAYYAIAYVIGGG